ncbi:MAG: alkaline phosphatase [Bacillota bacterium]|nr:alkaline phosphatase [Bacillota bacterium]
MRYFKKFLSIPILAILVAFLMLTNLAGCAFQPAEISASPEASGSSAVENVILLIGDGMGYPQITLSRVFNGNKPLAMDTFEEMGSVATYPEDDAYKWITDSAAAGTAIATGKKTFNGAISVDNDSSRLETILELAKKSGRATGLVTTATITNATPAVFAAHVPDRGNEDAIAVDMLKTQPDVMLGGGFAYFAPEEKGGSRADGRDLIAEAEAAGYTYVNNKDQMDQADGKILGLFSPGYMPYEIDRTSLLPALDEMTAKAIDVLSGNPKGFFMMVEGGRIDHAAHAHDAGTLVREVLAFDEAVKIAFDFAREDGNTLVIVTADHETAGLSLGSSAQGMVFDPDIMDGQISSIEEMVAESFKAYTAQSVDVKTLIQEYFGISGLSAGEEAALKEAFIEEKEGLAAGDNEYAGGFADAVTAFVSSKINVGWTSGGHTGSDVPIMAYGPNAEQLSGHIDNTEIFEAMKSAMGL